MVLGAESSRSGAQGTAGADEGSKRLVSGR